MPESVKISELPARQAVSSDILPAVDSTLSQTVRVTAAQIAAIGGGPPGDNTVTTVKLVNKAVTYEKIQDTTTSNVLIGRSSAGGGTVEEILCTPYARGLLAAPDATTALAAIGGLQSANNPTFTGTVTVSGTLTATGNITATGAFRASDGTQAAPSYAFTNDTDTGIFRHSNNILGLVAGGFTRATIESTAVALFVPLVTIPPGTTTPLVAYGVRAWGNYYGRTASPFFRGQAGFTSITKVTGTTGRYSFAFGFVMPDANYAVVCNGRTNNNFVMAGWDFTVNGFEIRQYDNNTDVLFDLDFGNVVVIR